MWEPVVCCGDYVDNMSHSDTWHTQPRYQHSGGHLNTQCCIVAEYPGQNTGNVQTHPLELWNYTDLNSAWVYSIIHGKECQIFNSRLTDRVLEEPMIQFRAWICLSIDSRENVICHNLLSKKTMLNIHWSFIKISWNQLRLPCHRWLWWDEMMIVMVCSLVSRAATNLEDAMWWQQLRATKLVWIN